MVLISNKIDIFCNSVFMQCPS